MAHWSRRLLLSVVQLALVVKGQVGLSQCPTATSTFTSSDGRNWQICPNSDYQLGSTSIIPGVASQTACVQLCASAAGCTKAVYDHVYSICHLKGNPSGPLWVASSQYDAIAIAVAVPPGTSITQCPQTPETYTSPNGVLYSICRGTDFQGETLAALPATNRTACAALCATWVGCTRAVFNSASGQCFLKTGPSKLAWTTDSNYDTILLSGPSSKPAPILGYNSYNDIGCSPTESWMQQSMDAMSSSGLLASGYKYFQLDCGWQGYQRSANGSITYDATRFPNGIYPLSQRASGLGLIWSMYTDQGVYSCDTSAPGRLGSLGFEQQDASMFALWNASYVKVDNCYVDPNNNAPKDPRTDFPSRYGAMWNALNAAGIRRSLICQWGTPWQDPAGQLRGPYDWVTGISTSYRLTDDVANTWGQVMRLYNQALHVGLRGKWQIPVALDLDLLEVGNNGMTTAEQQSQFALWAFLQSSLLVSTNIPQISSTTTAILQNADMLAVNQDALKIPARLIHRFSNDYDIFAGPLFNGDIAVLVIDQSSSARTLNLNLGDLGVQTADVKDLLTGNTQTGLSSVSRNVAAHGSMALRLTNIIASVPSPPNINYYEAEAGQLSGGASTAACTGCSGGLKVGSLQSGQSSSLTFTGIRTSQVTSDVLFDYINAEVQYLASEYTNVRSAMVSVNQGQAQQVLFPLSGYSWDQDVLKQFKVRLSGFNTNALNTITIQGGGQTIYAPDFDRVGVIA